MSEQSVAQEAHGLVHGARNKTYGHPYDDYTRTAGLWSAFLGVEITPGQAALMMLLMKVSRLRNTPDHRDSLVDACGYAMVAAEVEGVDRLIAGGPYATENIKIDGAILKKGDFDYIQK